MQTIHADDFSDIADIIWEEEVLMMNVRSNVGERSKGILFRLKKIVIHWIGTVEKNRDKLFCTEPTIAERCKII